LIRKLKSEILSEPIAIPTHGSQQRLGLNAIQLREILIEHHRQRTISTQI